MNMNWMRIRKSFPIVFLAFIMIDMMIPFEGSIIYKFIRSFLISYDGNQFILCLIGFTAFLSYEYYINTIWGRALAILLAVYLTGNAFLILFHAVYIRIFSLEQGSSFTFFTFLSLIIMPYFFRSIRFSWQKVLLIMLTVAILSFFLFFTSFQRQ